MQSKLQKLIVIFLVILLAGIMGAAQSLKKGYISGLVLSEKDERVNGVLIFAVEILDENQFNLSSEVEPHSECVLTNSIGFFELAVPAGGYEIRAVSDGYVTTVRHIELREGEIVFIDPFYLLPEAKICGTVFDGDATTPVAGAVIVASDTKGALFTSVSDANGQFALDGLPEGEFSLIAFSDEASFSWTAPVHVMTGAIVEGVNCIAVSAEPAGQKDFDTGEITGRVLLQPNSVAVPGAMITLADELNVPIDLEADPTNELGVFHIHGIEFGTFRLSVSHPEFAGIFIEDVVVRAGEVTEVPDILLLPSAGELRGIVSAEDGTPIPDALVVAVSGSSYQTAIADDVGSFILRNLPKGEYEVAAFADGFVLATTPGVTIHANATAPELGLILEVTGNEK